MRNKIKNETGIAAILTVLIISAAMLVIARSTISVSIGESERTYTQEKGEAALAFAEGCVGETLRRFQLDPGYTANGEAFPLGSGNCTVNTLADNDARTIVAVGQIGDYYKSIEAGIIIQDNGIMLTSWQEITP